ncbi:uncharacterized protein RCC_12331 [Ramularia collo-cygni]|uniref:Zn(2)-C6 fungal-type domain-containing protein n=1 Tax=Ramularia collo-cygni TaxID=112498 RepID=A0A2D3UP36_9PEZI|nr:uncharacterized protein RCC_12331 [Ramularia collo-cygni]CZT15488.1 uncharacterized protein RCC_12331 [Ramularia collo-cygni]
MSAPKRRVPEGSCWSCKKRRLKCDLRQPTCSKCEVSSVTCDYSQKPIQWVGGAAFRGLLKSIGPPPVTEHNSTTHNDPHRPRSACSSPQQSSIYTAISSPMMPESLVSYFTHAVWPRFQLSGQIISLDEDMLVHESALRDAVLAVAQAHHHLLLKSEESVMAKPGGQTRRQARQVALSRFRTRIERGVESEEEASRLFQIVCMFCILDGMIYPDDQGNASEQHLRGGFSMLSSWSSIPLKMLLAGGLQAHLFSIFATVDLMHSLLDGTKPFFEPTMWFMFAGVQAWWGRLHPGDPFLAVLKLYSEMAFLGSIVYVRLPGLDGLRLAERCLEPILGSLRTGLPRSTTPDFTTPEDWNTFCSLYEASAAVYVYRALQNRRVDDETVQRIVRNAVSSIVDRPLPDMMAHCLIFPLLVIGSHCLYSQDQRAILDLISSSASYLAFGNLIVMMNLLREIWSQSNMNSNWWDMFRPISKNVFLF